MSEPAKKPGQVPESYQPQKPEMMRALEAAQGQTAIEYQRYKSIDFYLERVSFPETLKIAGVPWQEGFGNIGDYHQNYKDKMPGKYEPYADAEISFFAKKYGNYIFGCRVTSIDNLPSGVIGIDTGYRDFEVLTFRAADFFALVGGADGPGEAMKDAGEYTKEVWLPAHQDEVEFYNADKMWFKMKMGREDFGCGGIGIYRNTSEENPEMCHFIPLKAKREPGRLNKNKKKKRGGENA